jgi:hypothetical protein
MLLVHGNAMRLIYFLAAMLEYISYVKLLGLSRGEGAS